MRETGQTVVPMVSGLAAVAVNMSLNYVLIFGKLGMPVLGVKGAAIATVISRYTELAVNAAWLHSHGKRYPYIRAFTAH
ncbi:MAG: polysaccharide biosynthesis C-terminal domain-containing protein [Oscillospiraceae bacterium]